MQPISMNLLLSCLKPAAQYNRVPERAKPDLRAAAPAKE